MLKRGAAILRTIQFPLVFVVIGDTWSVYLLGDRPGADPAANQVRDLLLLACCAGGIVVAGGVMRRMFHPPQDGISVRAAWILGAGGMIVAIQAAVTMGADTVAMTLLLGCGWLLIGALRNRWPAAECLLRGVVHAAHAQLGMRFGMLGIWVSAWLLIHHCLLAAVVDRVAGRQHRPSWAGVIGLAWVTPLMALAWVGVGQAWLLDIDMPTRDDLTAPLVAVGSLAIVGVGILCSERLGSTSIRTTVLAATGVGWTLVYQMAFLSAAGNMLGVLVMLFLLAMSATAAQLTVALSRLSEEGERSKGVEE